MISTLHLWTWVVLLLPILLIIMGCSQELVDLASAVDRHYDTDAVRIDAGGPYQVIAGDVLTLQASVQTDADVDVESVSWTVVAGDAVIEWIDKDGLAVDLRALEPGTAIIDIEIRYDIRNDLSGTRSASDQADLAVLAPSG